jgi:SAM-dependent methyltransferase
MSDPALDFYESLADDYRLLFGDWNATVERQAAVLGTLLSAMGVPPGGSVLDCAAGIGTQAIGLAARGYRVTATDLSPAPLEKLRQEAAARKLSIPSRTADLRSLDAAVTDQFDAVIAMDNALPHLPTEDDLALAIRQMRSRLRPGGAWVASVRDYDQLRKERPHFSREQVMDTPAGRWITFQLWDWAPDGSGYGLEQFVLRESGGGRWETHCHRGRYRAVGREELERSMEAAGLTQVQWRTPDSTGFFQPILTGRAP